MITETLAHLIYLQSQKTFSKTLVLIPNIFEIYDVANNNIFTHYSGLNHLISFATYLDQRGWIEGTHFWFTQEPHTTRLNLLNGNIMDEYIGWHQEKFYNVPPPPVNQMPVFYWTHLIRFVEPPGVYVNFITSNNKRFYDTWNYSFTVKKTY